MHAYAELQITSNFTFLTGASHPQELVAQAAALGHCAVALTDTHTLAGIVRAHQAAKEHGIPLVVGSRLLLMTLPHCPPLELLVYPTTRAGYGRLCRLLTLGKRRAPKGECHLTLHDFLEQQAGLLAVVVPPRDVTDHTLETLAGLRDYLQLNRNAGEQGDRLSLAVSRLFTHDDTARLRQIIALAEHTRIPLVAVNDVHYHAPDRRPLQDVLTCIRLGVRIDEAGRRLFANAERHLKSPDEVARLFTLCPEAVERAVEVARRATAFSLDELRYQYPDETCPPGKTPIEHLTSLAWAGARERYGAVPPRVRKQIDYELALIDELDYARYFLTVQEIVEFARSKNILCQGRGAAANSAVCYCLGVTAVDPDRIDVLFERFISRERKEPPDIDIDFEHERREEVIQHLYSKYGRHRAALTAVVISYRPRSAIRDVGKALGFSLDTIDRLAKSIDWWDSSLASQNRIRELGLDPQSDAMKQLVTLGGQLLGFPRHLSQHPGGFVLTRDALSDLVPIENAAMEDRTVIEWDKDDIDAMGMLKVDVLGLGMMTCIRKSIDLVNESTPPGAAGTQPSGAVYPLAYHTIPPEDPRVYDMICDADTVGVFQIESRAQMSMLPRLKPRTYYDLVIEVAIVRPGPIHGDMVHPYLRRRDGIEAIPPYHSQAVRQVLEKTKGVPLFQEQAMALSIVAAGFTPGEADQLRRAIASWRRKQHTIEAFGKKLIEGMTRNGYPLEFACRCFEQIKGFSEYGFPESHAASFALLVYVSAWLKCHHPAAFAAGLINSQPMGFYAPAQIVRDAQEHGVTALPVDVHHSQWDCTLERLPAAGRADARHTHALRLGMRLVKGMSADHAGRIVEAVRRWGGFRSIAALHRASGVSVGVLRRLAKADAFGSLGLDRQASLWQVRALSDESLPLFDACEDEGESPAITPFLPAIPGPNRIAHDYAATGLSLKAHPISFIRPSLDALRVTPNRETRDEARWPHGSPIAVAGLVLVRQRPETASGLLFVTLEDETGIVNLIVRPHIYEKYRAITRHAAALLMRGRLERKGAVVHIIATRIHDLTADVLHVTPGSHDFH